MNYQLPEYQPCHELMQSDPQPRPASVPMVPAAVTTPTLRQALRDYQGAVVSAVAKYDATRSGRGRGKREAH